MLLYFVRRRRDVPFSWMFLMFGLFIVSCGFTHLMEVVAFYDPQYRLAGLIKLVTAVASVATVFGLVPLVPRALALRSPEELEREVVQRRQAEAELAENNRRLIEAERLKSQFFANVSHELRTPLTLILAPLESLLTGRDRPLSEDQRRDLEAVHNNAVRLLQMVNGLLDFSKLEAGKVSVSREPVDAAALTRSLFADFEPLLRQKGLAGQLDVPADPVTVALDRYLYERILFNLLANAVKFTPPGGRVSVGLEAVDGRLRLTVRDTGIGIAPEDLPRLFLKFQQLEGSATRRFEGTGLGLALVKEFAELLGGAVRVESRPGQGAAFTVDVAAPRATPGSPPEPGAGGTTAALVPRYEARPAAGPVPGGDRPAAKILVAEDNPELAAYLSAQLHDQGEVRLAEDGERALALAREWQPDLVLSDVMMPRKDGLSLCRDLKADPTLARTPVVLLTALTHRDALIKGWEAGADDYLFKPFHPQELAARVRSLLALGRERRRAEDALRRLNTGLEQMVRERTEELRRANEALQDADRRKDEFLAMLAHELRNPLAPIVNCLYVLRRKDTDPALAPALDMMERQARHLTRLVDELLDVSRVTRGKVQLQRERLDLARLVRTAVEDRRPVLDQAGLRLELAVPDTPVWVSGDATRLTQVVNNLLDNAVKFRGEDGTVGIRLVPDDGRLRAELVVRDEGIGIEPGTLSRLFTPFVQADRSLDRSRGGLGLGLALVQGLVGLHGGEVTAFSEGPGRGATFTVRLPLEPEPTALAPGQRPAAPPGVAPRRVLIIEDNPDAAESLRLFLEMLGHQVAVAATGPDGVRRARAWRPDVILCDIGLPGLDGYGVAVALRRHPETARTRLIAVTGYGQESDRARAREAGFDHHLVKPVNPAEVEQLLAAPAGP